LGFEETELSRLIAVWKYLAGILGGHHEGGEKELRVIRCSSAEKRGTARNARESETVCLDRIRNLSQWETILLEGLNLNKRRSSLDRSAMPK